MRAEEIIKKKNEHIRFLESRIHNLRKQRDETHNFNHKIQSDLMEELHAEELKFLDTSQEYYELLEENTKLRVDSMRLLKAMDYIKELEDRNKRLEQMFIREVEI